MKTVVPSVLILLIISTILFHTGCTGDPEKTTTDEKIGVDTAAQPTCFKPRVFFENEDSLNLKGYIKTSSAARELSDAFAEKIRYQNPTTYVNGEATPIKMSHLAEFSKDIRSRARHMSCIKIHYGLKNKKIVPLFELGWVETVKPQGDKYEFHTTFEGIIYSYSIDAKFVRVANRYKDQLVANYRDSMLIQHLPDDPTFGKIIALPDLSKWENDAQSIIYSFQELFRFYEMTLVEGESLPGYCGFIYLQNSVGLYTNEPELPRFKHSMFFSRIKYDKTTLLPITILTDPTMAANLAHLSPPNTKYCMFAAYSVQP